MPIYGQIPVFYKPRSVVAGFLSALTRRWRINIRLQQPLNSRLKVVKLSKNDRYPLSGFIYKT
jgi:hypothetical protein